MAKTKKNKWGYIIPAVLLLLGALFLYLKTNGASGGFASGGYKSSGYFSGGKLSEGLDVKTVRWHKHDGYERLVFDIYAWDGVFGNHPYKKSHETGLYQIGMELQNALSLDGELSGYRDFSAKMPHFANSKMLKKMQVLSNDDGSYLFTLELKRAVTYKVFTLKNPARIVIDIK